MHIENTEIDGVDVVHLDPRIDDRGRFVETYREEWFPGRPAMVQGNRSDSRPGVLRGLHYHLHQADYWYAASGELFVALHDLRRSSPTRGVSVTLRIGPDDELGVYVPPGVAHGFQAVTEATLTYLVDRTYEPADEHGLAWDDPAAAIPWPVPDPVLSGRDLDNPRLDDIDPGDLPG